MPKKLVLAVIDSLRPDMLDEAVSEGQAPWEVQAICGEPAQVQDTVEIILQPVYDPFGRVVDHLPVAVPKSVWTYNFGSSRLIYFLTFRDGKLAHIETGGYGH